MDYDFDNMIEVSYTVLGYDEAGETTFEMEVSNYLYKKLQNAMDKGEYLDSYFISENMRGIHRKILKAIRENMDELSWNPDDGKVEEVTSWGTSYMEDCPGASHSHMLIMADDDDIEYTIVI